MESPAGVAAAAADVVTVLGGTLREMDTSWLESDDSTLRRLAEESLGEGRSVGMMKASSVMASV